MEPAAPGRYEWLSFNAPLSEDLAAALASRLIRRSPSRVLDIGCGWGELLLRIVASSPSTRGVGIDTDRALLERASTNATARRVTDRVVFTTVPAVAPSDAADVVMCIGADHIWASQHDALVALHELVLPGGRLLFGTGFWERPTTRDEAATLGAKPADLLLLADLVDLAISTGFRVVDLRTASRQDWEQFEFGYLADHEEWLSAWPHDPRAEELSQLSHAHRTGYLRGWRDFLGFAFLILARPIDRDSTGLPPPTVAA